MLNPLKYFLYLFASYQAVIAFKPNTYPQNQADLDNCFELPNKSAQSDCLLELSSRLPLGNQLAFTHKLMTEFSTAPEISNKFKERFSELMSLKPLIESLIDLNSALPNQYKTKHENLDNTIDKIKLRARLLFGLCKQFYEKHDYQAMKYAADRTYDFLVKNQFTQDNPETKFYISKAMEIYQCALEIPDTRLTCQQAFFSNSNHGITINIKPNETAQALHSM